MLLRITRILLLIALFGTFHQNELFGQTPAQIARALDRLNRELEFTKELVRAFRNAKAQELVLLAEKAREQAREAIKNRQPQVAESSLRTAFMHLQQAQKITLSGPVGRWRSRIEETLRRAEHEVLGRNHKEAERVLQKARENRRAAENALMGKKYSAALDHYQAAVEWAERAIELVRSSGVRDDYLEARQRFETLRERAIDAVEKSDDANARRIYEQALRMFRSAEQAVKNKQLQSAKRLYNQSILLLLRVIDLSRGDTRDGHQNVTIALERLQELIDNTRDSVERQRRRGPKRIFERGVAYARQAQVAASRGNPEEALLKIELAETLVRRAHRMSNRSGGRNRSDRIFQEIEKTQAEISDVRLNVDAATPEDVQMLLRMSQAALDRAERAAALGRDRVALESVLAAQRFLSHAVTTGREPSLSSISSARLELRMKQLDAAIAEAEGLLSENQSWERQLVEAAKDIRRMAIESLETGNLRAAEEAMRVAFELIRKSTRNIPRD